MPSIVNNNAQQSTWDVPLTDSRYRNGYTSPDKRSVKSISSNLTKRTRSHSFRRTNRTIKTLKLKRHPDIGFGFSIRGGVEHGTGIFISSLHQYSDAFSQGLQVGDQILRANKIYFNEISHEQAFYYIQSLRSVTLVVLSLGIIPGSTVSYSEYQWIDCYGRPCSPLQVTYPIRNDQLNDSNGSNISRYLEAEDERKVNIVVGDNLKLGLLIRGGTEYGLGIFVAGIDEDSVADRSGIMVGEQILEVNGIDFIDITHADAAHIIRTSKMMTMILKDVEKIPLARIIYDDEEMMKNGNIQRARSPNKREIEAFKLDSKDGSAVFQAGIAGSQLQHNATSNPMSYRWIEEKAQKCLTEEEWSTLKYYLREYVHQSITINGLVLSLFDLLDNSEKMRLLMEVRGVVRAQDIDIFDEMVLKKQVDNIEIENESYSREEDEVNVERIEEIFVENNPSENYSAKNNKIKTLGRRMKKMGLLNENEDLDEETFDSLVNNIRKESEQATSARDQYVYERESFQRNADVSSNEGESPTYATIKRKPKSILRDTSSLRSNYSDDTSNYQSPIRGIENLSDVTNEALQEEANNLANALEQYNDIYDEDDDDEGDENESVNDYNIANSNARNNFYNRSDNEYDENENEDDASDYQRVNDEEESATDDYQDVQNQSDTSPSSSGSNTSRSTAYENNKLGYAFNFLANENGNGDISEKSSSSEKSDDSANLKTSRDSHRSELLEEIRKSSLQENRGPLKELINSHPKEKPLRNFIKRNSFENPSKLSQRSSQGKINIKKKVSVTPPASEREQSDKNNDSEDNDSVKSSRFFRDLQSAGRSGNFMENYQPKSLSRSNEEDFFETIKPEEEIKTESSPPQIMIENPSPLNKKSSYSESQNAFDATPSVEHRISNFSVNDILRQNYLPTTRVEYDPNESLSESSTQNNSFDNQQHARNRSLTRLSSLHIQNQYQYEKKVEKAQKPEPVKLIIENVTQEPTENLFMDPLRPSLQLRKNSFEGDKKKTLMELREKYRKKDSESHENEPTQNINSEYRNSSFFDYRNMSFNISNESLGKFIDEPKTYGKPVMTKSPRPEFSEPVNFDSLRRKETERLSATEENNFYDLSSLKRNSNSQRIKAEVLREMISRARSESNGDEEPIDTSALLRQKIAEELARRLSVTDEKKKESVKFMRLKQNFEQDMPLVSSDVNENSISKQVENLKNDPVTSHVDPVIIQVEEPEIESLNIDNDFVEEEPATESPKKTLKYSPRGNLIQARIKALTQSDENLNEPIQTPSPVYITPKPSTAFRPKSPVPIRPTSSDDPPKTPIKIVMERLRKSPVHVAVETFESNLKASDNNNTPKSLSEFITESPMHLRPKSPVRIDNWQNTRLRRWENNHIRTLAQSYENINEEFSPPKSPSYTPVRKPVKTRTWRNSQNTEIRTLAQSYENINEEISPPKSPSYTPVRKPVKTRTWRNSQNTEIRALAQSYENINQDISPPKSPPHTPYTPLKKPVKTRTWRNSASGTWEPETENNENNEIKSEAPDLLKNNIDEDLPPLNIDHITTKTPIPKNSWRSSDSRNWERIDANRANGIDERPNRSSHRTPPSGLLEKEIEIPRIRDDPGFTVDVRTRFKMTEIYIDQIKNKDLEDYLSVGDTILEIGGNPLRKAVKKGLANIIIKTAFNSSTDPKVVMKIRTKYLK